MGRLVSSARDAYSPKRHHRGAHLAASHEPRGFAKDIKPLFRERDRDSMKSSFDLWSRTDVARNSDAILKRLREGTMPCDGAWQEEQIAVFQDWVTAGTPA